MTVDGKKMYRYMKALPTQDLCLQCHGTPDRISPAVQAYLQTKQAECDPDKTGNPLARKKIDAMESALTSLGYTFLGVTDAQFQAMTVDDLLEYLAVFHAGTTGLTGSPSASENLLVAYLDAGGSLYISDNDLGYYRQGSTFYGTYLQSTYVVDNGGDYLDGLDLMAGLPTQTRSIDNIVITINIPWSSSGR